MMLNRAMKRTLYKRLFFLEDMSKFNEIKCLMFAAFKVLE